MKRKNKLRLLIILLLLTLATLFGVIQEVRGAIIYEDSNTLTFIVNNREVLNPSLNYVGDWTIMYDLIVNTDPLARTSSIFTLDFVNIGADDHTDRITNLIVHTDFNSQCQAGDFRVSFGQLGHQVCSNTPILRGQEYNLAYTYSNGVVNLYVNGVLEDTNTNMPNKDLKAITQQIGCRHNSGGANCEPNTQLIGTLSNFKVYDESLSESQINEIIGGVPTPPQEQPPQNNLTCVYNQTHIDYINNELDILRLQIQALQTYIEGIN